MDDYEGLTDEELFSKVLNFLEEGDLVQAQTALDAVKVSCGRKYFLQGKIFLAKSWHSEAKKQFEFALECEPDNQEYKDAADGVKEENPDGLPEPPKQVGKFDGCHEACCECSCEACCLGLCEGLCDGCG